MNANAQFDASLPAPYTENWREAYRADSSESPRMASYQAPGGEVIPFIQKRFRFSGGRPRIPRSIPSVASGQTSILTKSHKVSPWKVFCEVSIILPGATN
jgi:hypothetical protein